jgi:DNA-binding transcriptional LysR family regulator
LISFCNSPRTGNTTNLGRKLRKTNDTRDVDLQPGDLSAMRIDFNGVEAFLGIATWGSFTQAAAHLNLSQAALSHRLKKLEDSVGVPLLARTTREISLTPAGLELLPVAQTIFKEASSKLDSLRQRAKIRSERVAFGCLPTVARACLPSVLQEFQKQFPDTAVQVYDNSTGEIGERVRAGEAEFAITIVSVNAWDLEVKSLVKEPFVVICAAPHRFAKRPSVNWRELVDEPLIRVSAETGNRILIDEALGPRRETVNWRYEVQRVATALSLVREGVALAIVPRMGLGLAADSGIVAVPLRNPSISRKLGIVTRRGAPLSPAASVLLTLMSEKLAKESRMPSRQSSRQPKSPTRSPSKP